MGRTALPVDPDACIGLSSITFAQEQSTSAIWRGLVKNSVGTPIVGAQVRLKGTSTAESTAAADGSFSLAALPGRQQTDQKGGEKLSSQKVNELPLNGRDFSTLLIWNHQLTFGAITVMRRDSDCFGGFLSTSTNTWRPYCTHPILHLYHL
jgi:hypothetical protein